MLKFHENPFILQIANVDIVALVNDTTATLLSMAGKAEAPDCYIGLILDSGTNACYMEKFDADTIPKYKGDFSPEHVIINCEWGAFGDDGKLDKWLTLYDRQLDKETVNCGEHL